MAVLAPGRIRIRAGICVGRGRIHIRAGKLLALDEPGPVQGYFWPWTDPDPCKVSFGALGGSGSVQGPTRITARSGSVQGQTNSLHGSGSRPRRPTQKLEPGAPRTPKTRPVDHFSPDRRFPTGRLCAELALAILGHRARYYDAQGVLVKSQGNPVS